MEPQNASAVERRVKLRTFAALWIFAFAALVLFRSAILPFAGSALIAYVVAPAVDRIAQVRVGKRTVPRWVAILIIYAGFFLLVYVVLTALVPQIYRELARIAREALDFTNSLSPERIQELAQSAESWLSDHGVPLALSSRSLEGGEIDGTTIPPAGQPNSPWSMALDLNQVIRDMTIKFSGAAKENLTNILSISRSIIGGIIASIFTLFFMLMVAAFFSVDAAAIRSYCRTLIPSEYAQGARELIGRIDRALAGVVRGQLTICLVNGTLTFIGLMIFGVKFAFVLATVALLFSLIPIFGTIISSVPIVLIALSQSWKKGLAMLLWIIGIHALEAYFLNPKILGSAARIHPVVVAFALIAGERTYGLVGALFAVPLAAIAVACFDFARVKALEYQGRTAASSRPEPRRPDQRAAPD
jgi:predicted PurR-regulated permease PerM